MWDDVATEFRNAMIARAALAIIVLAPVLHAGAEEEIRAAEKDWAAAVVAQDFAEMEKIYHDDLVYAHSTGIIETKAEYLGKLKSGKQKYTAIDHEKTTVVPNGDSAVAHSIVVMKGTNASGPFDNKLMMMHVWFKQAGRWRLAAHQTTLLPR